MKIANEDRIYCSLLLVLFQFLLFFCFIFLNFPVNILFSPRRPLFCTQQVCPATNVRMSQARLIKQKQTPTTTTNYFSTYTIAWDLASLKTFRKYN